MGRVEVRALKYDAEVEAKLTEAFETVGDVLIHVLAAAAKDDWQTRHRAAEDFGKAAAGVYKALCEASATSTG